jgi:hypothetical protein
MSVGRILRKPLKAELQIQGQEIISGEYAETISKFETVFANLVPEVPGPPE